MSHDATQTADGFDWSDPHSFHHDDAPEGHGEHHVTSWQTLVGVLVALLILTGLTVAAAAAEQWAVEMGAHISHFWNVLIALSIAVVKAALVCMYFMHLKHDNPLNTMVLLTTLFVFGLFLFLTGLDIAERDTVNEFKAEYAQAGGTGVGMVPGGGSLGTNITRARKNQAIETIAASIAAEHDREEPTEEDIAEARAEFWGEFYHHKLVAHPAHLPERHPEDETDFHEEWVQHALAHAEHIETSDADKSRPRHGLTPGLFDEEDPLEPGAGEDDVGAHSDPELHTGEH